MFVEEFAFSSSQLWKFVKSDNNIGEIRHWNGEREGELFTVKLDNFATVWTYLQ